MPIEVTLSLTIPAFAPSYLAAEDAAGWEKTWCEAAAALSQIDIENEQFRHRVSFDWAVAGDAAIAWRRAPVEFAPAATMGVGSDSKTVLINVPSGILQGLKVTVPIRVETSSKIIPDAKFSSMMKGSGATLEQFDATRCAVVQAFLAMNISSPGSLNLMGGFLSNGQFSWAIDIPAYEIEGALAEGNVPWPRIERMPLEAVWSWLNQFSIQFRQVASCRTERALFALLRVSSSDPQFVTPESLLWVTYAIESLFDTPDGGGILDALKRRVFLVHGVPLDHKVARRHVANFYDLRSRLTHGSFDICLPRQDALFDERVRKHNVELIEGIYYGIVLCIATLQELVRQNAKEFSFQEKLLSTSFEHAADNSRC